MGKIFDRYLVTAIAYLVASAIGPCHETSAATRHGGEPPNIIIVFADDQGYQDVGVFGSPLIETPNLDRMAGEGMKFTDFYSAAPVCTPSRAALMTGCYAPRVSLPSVLNPSSTIGIHSNEITIAEILKGQGYATACVGKWHLGHLAPFLPRFHGFDEYFGLPYSNDMSIPAGRPPLPLVEGETTIELEPDQSQLTYRYTMRAVDFIIRNRNNRFFLYLPHTMPHVPLFASREFDGRSARGLYGDVIEEIDWSVGVILDTLESLGINDRTLIVYTSDNGPWLSKGENGGSALPLRNGKGTTYEGGMREPTLMWWPGWIPAGSVCTNLAGTIDLLPTLAGLAGTNAPSDRVIDGRDIWPLMSGQPGADTPHDYYYYYRANTLEAVRSGRWKYRRVSGNDQLFDLYADISEATNQAAAHPDIVSNLLAQITSFNQSLTADKRPAGSYAQQSITGLEWRADANISVTGSPPYSLAAGDTWGDYNFNLDLFTVTDNSAADNIEIESTSASSIANLPSRAVNLTSPSGELKLVRSGGFIFNDRNLGQPVSVEMWWRSNQDAPATNGLLFETGGTTYGLSLTLGDGEDSSSFRGTTDDSVPGRKDDLRFRLGAGGSAAVRTLTVDLPNHWDTDFLQVVGVYDGTNVKVYVDGQLAGDEGSPTSSIEWEGTDNVGLLGPANGVGGNGGSGDRPFAAAGGQGRVALLRFYDRGLSTEEVLSHYRAITDLEVAPREVVFGLRDVLSGPSAPMDVIISNGSPDTVNLAGVYLGGRDVDDFEIMADTGETSLASGQKRVVQARFDPRDTGLRYAGLKVQVDGITSPILEIPLSGVGIISSPPATPQSPFPANGAMGTLVWTSLAWQDGDGADGYEVTLWKQGENKPDQPTAVVGESLYFPDHYLAFGTGYVWEVVATNAFGSTPAGGWAFSTAPEGSHPEGPSYDISGSARQERESLYDITGRLNLVMPGTALTDGMTISFFGDSITWLGGYHQKLEEAVEAAGYTNVTILNRGINGAEAIHIRDGANGLYGQTQGPFADLLAVDQSEMAVLYVGINDAHRHDGTPQDVEAFEQVYRDLIEQALVAGVMPLAVTPSVRGERPDGENPDDAAIDLYAGVIRTLADEYDIPLLDLRAIYLAYLKNNNYFSDGGTGFYSKTSFVLTRTGYQPNQEGETFLADHVAEGIRESMLPLIRLPEGPLDPSADFLFFAHTIKGWNYTYQYSSNLVSWEDLETGTAVSNRTPVMDAGNPPQRPHPRDVSRRYYRARYNKP